MNMGFDGFVGDVPYETLKMGGLNLVIEYLKTKKSEKSNDINGRFTAKYRRVTLFSGEDILYNEVEENPHYIDDMTDDALNVIHEGLSLSQIRSRIEKDEGYLVVLWIRGRTPLPIEFGNHKDVVLALIDDATDVTDLAIALLKYYD